MKQKHFLCITLCLCIAGTTVAALTPLQNNIKRAQRRANVSIIRNSASQETANQPIEEQKTNGDEQRYADKRGSYGKVLVQDANGLINTSAFEHMVRALETGNITLLNTIPLGTSPVQRRLVDPQAAYAFNLGGADSWIHILPTPPALASAQLAGEMVELYGQAYLRDLPFNEYDSSPLASDVIDYLNALSDFKGPKIAGMVTPETLFRSSVSGDLVGPYISQFLYLPVPYGPGPNYDGTGTMPPLNTPNYQMQVAPTSNIINDFMIDFTTWSDIQKGMNPTATITYDLAERHFIRNGRDLASYARECYPGQEGINPALILLSYGPDALDRNNPYLNNPTQQGFVTCAIADIMYLVCAAEEMALRAAWYQKWLVHRRARPEFTGFLVNQQKSGAQDFGLNSEIITSGILDDIFVVYNSYFLPQAYPEGSPAHPAYPEGHSTVIGACVTMLKAFFNEDFVIPSPVQPNITNDTLEPYTATILTVGNELNKLASNISMGRCSGGVHYRSDAIEGMILGEKVAIALLQNAAATYHIPFSGFSLTTFGGKKIVVGAQPVPPLY
jgi:hypothetical protein